MYCVHTICKHTRFITRTTECHLTHTSLEISLKSHVLCEPYYVQLTKWKEVKYQLKMCVCVFFFLIRFKIHSKTREKNPTWNYARTHFVNKIFELYAYNSELYASSTHLLRYVQSSFVIFVSFYSVSVSFSFLTAMSFCVVFSLRFAL